MQGPAIPAKPRNMLGAFVALFVLIRRMVPVTGQRAPTLDFEGGAELWPEFSSVPSKREDLIWK